MPPPFQGERVEDDTRFWQELVSRTECPIIEAEIS
jgi:hypothetical protein